jgi:hypothetical protein
MNDLHVIITMMLLTDDEEVGGRDAEEASDRHCFEAYRNEANEAWKIPRGRADMHQVWISPVPKSKRSCMNKRCDLVWL